MWATFARVSSTSFGTRRGRAFSVAVQRQGALIDDGRVRCARRENDEAEDTAAAVAVCSIAPLATLREVPARPERSPEPETSARIW